MRLNSRAWPHRFEEVPWRDIAARFDAMAAEHPESPSSGFVGAGGVFIEHRSVTGHDDGIFRDGAEAVPLFWRFMIEKFGVESGFGAQR